MAAFYLISLLAIGVVATAANAAGPVIQGRIVDVRQPNTVLLAHAAYGGMPAMTMPFEVDRSVLKTLRRGLTISGVLDRRTSPPTIDAVRIDGAPARLAAYIPALHEGDTVPDVALVDQRGTPVTISSFRGQSLVLSFMYTRCGDRNMCPLVSAKFARLQHDVAREHVHLMEVTLDPGYDTVRVLAHYGAAYGADPRRWTLGTGNTGAIAQLAARAGIVAVPTARGVVHSEAVLVIDPQGRLVTTLDGAAWTVDELHAQARAANGALPSVAARLGLWLQSGVAAVCGGASGISTRTALAIFFGLLIAAALVFRKMLSSGSA